MLMTSLKACSTMPVMEIRIPLSSPSKLDHVDLDSPIVEVPLSTLEVASTKKWAQHRELLSLRSPRLATIYLMPVADLTVTKVSSN